MWLLIGASGSIRHSAAPVFRGFSHPVSAFNCEIQPSVPLSLGFEARKKAKVGLRARHMCKKRHIEHWQYGAGGPRISTSIE
jgi:hypothetical protein